MRRTAAILAVAALAGALPAAALAGAIDLRIEYRATGSAAPKLLTLHCAPARGTVASPAAAAAEGGD